MQIKMVRVNVTQTNIFIIQLINFQIYISTVDVYKFRHLLYISHESPEDGVYSLKHVLRIKTFACVTVTPPFLFANFLHYLACKVTFHPYNVRVSTAPLTDVTVRDILIRETVQTFHSTALLTRVSQWERCLLSVCGASDGSCAVSFDLSTLGA
jgi:hypothetical protein